ncbi:Uncharacterised protein [Mycobacteroides abscessus subsp. abscessus]|nr:Uncharacterised protein [Mycobacteroides abscessus subsp. abscessus]
MSPVPFGCGTSPSDPTMKASTRWRQAAEASVYFGCCENPVHADTNGRLRKV